MTAALALFETDAVLTTTCARCGQAPATTRIHSRPDLQVRDRWPYSVTGPATVTAPPLHAGTDSAPMCGPCGRFLAAAWRSTWATACGAVIDLWVVWTTPIGPLGGAL